MLSSVYVYGLTAMYEPNVCASVDDYSMTMVTVSMYTNGLVFTLLVQAKDCSAS
jgi:hypothetical protein